MGRNKKLHYHIRWRGYSEAHDTWEPENNVKHVQELVNKFHEQHPIAARETYLNDEGRDSEDLSPSLMSPNASQNSSQSDLSLPIDWTPYPTTTNDNGPMAAYPTSEHSDNPASLSTTVSRLTLTNPGAVQVVNAAPIWVRTTTTTTAQPPAAVHPPFQHTSCHRRPAWTYLEPEVYDSDGERRHIYYSTSPSSDSHSSPPPLPRGTSQSPPATSSVATSAYQTAPPGSVSPLGLPSPPRSDHGSTGQDEGAHYLGEGTQ